MDSIQLYFFKEHIKEAIFRNPEHMAVGLISAGSGAIGGALSDDENRLRNAAIGSTLGLSTGYAGYNAIDPALYASRARLLTKLQKGHKLTEKELKDHRLLGTLLRGSVYSGAGGVGFAAGKGMSESVKEAQNNKENRGLNKMQQAALLGGGAAMLGLGGLGYALHKGAKETAEISENTKKSIERASKAMESFDEMVKNTRKNDKKFADKVSDKMKNINLNVDSSGFGD